MPRKTIFFVVICGCVFAIYRRPIATVRFGDGANFTINKLVIGREFVQTARLERPWSWRNWNPFRQAQPPINRATEISASYSMMITEFERSQEMQIAELGDALFIAVSGKDAHAAQATEPSVSIDVWTGEHIGWTKCQKVQGSGLDTVFIATIFSRSDSRIRLRWNREPEAPIELKIANPKLMAPAPWKTEPLPATKPFSQGTVRLTATWKKDGLWMCRIRAVAEQNPEWFDVRLVNVSDATGNYLNYDDPRNPLPPGNGAWRAKFAIHRSQKYPAKFNDCVMIGQGAFDDPAKPPTIVPSAQLSALGNVILTAAWNGKNPQISGDNSFEFKCNITDSVPLDMLTEQTGHWRIFVDGELLPATQDVFHSQGWGRTDNTYNGRWSYYWTGIMKSGTKFRIAAPIVVPPEIVEFTFEPPPFQGEKK
jgi:hypothetical protein